MKLPLTSVLFLGLTILTPSLVEAVPITYRIDYTMTSSVWTGPVGTAAPGPVHTPLSTVFVWDSELNQFGGPHVSGYKPSFSIRWQTSYGNYVLWDFMNPPFNDGFRGFNAPSEATIFEGLLGGGSWSVWVVPGTDVLFEIDEYSSFSSFGGNFIGGDRASGTFVTTRVPESGETALLLALACAGLYGPLWFMRMRKSGIRR